VICQLVKFGIICSWCGEIEASPRAAAAGDSYLFTHPLLLRYFALQDRRRSVPTPLPTRTGSRQIGTSAGVVGLALLAIDLTVEQSWRSGWQGALALAIIWVTLMIMSRMPSGGFIIAEIIIPHRGSWEVPELQKEAAAPAPYIIANAQRATRAVMHDTNARKRFAWENSRLIESITALVTIREPVQSPEQALSVIADGVALGVYLAREDSRPTRIPNLTRTLILKEGTAAGGEQAGIAIYAAYAAYRMTCRSALGRYLFLRRIAKVERTERARTATPSGISF
jgi:hypothetical protein